MAIRGEKTVDKKPIAVTRSERVGVAHARMIIAIKKLEIALRNAPVDVELWSRVVCSRYGEWDELQRLDAHQTAQEIRAERLESLAQLSHDAAHGSIR